MYDTLIVKCPDCGSPMEFQSKAGACSLYEYTIHNVPDDVAIDLKDETQSCDKCGYVAKIRVQVIKVIEVI